MCLPNNKNQVAIIINCEGVTSFWVKIFPFRSFTNTLKKKNPRTAVNWESAAWKSPFTSDR